MGEKAEAKFPCGACYGLRDVNCLTCGRKANSAIIVATKQAIELGSVNENLTRWSQDWQNEQGQKRLELLYGI